jgi:glycosyltransferase involved in cell wall biosynthesis
MKILYLTQFFSSIGGGGEVIFNEYAEGMAKRGHSIDVICHKIATQEDSGLDGVTAHRIRPTIEHMPPSITHDLIYILNATFKGLEIIRQKKIELIHSNNFSPVIAGSILSRICNIPLITTIHDIFTTSSPDYWSKWASQKNVSYISSLIGPLFEKITVRLAVDNIHTVSNASKEDLIKFNSNSKVTVIPNGIDLEKYDGLIFEKGDKKKYVLFIGRLLFYKNVDVVISSFIDVIKKLPDAKFVIVGNGPMRNEWEKRVYELKLNHAIEFTGHVSHQRKVQLLSECSALVLPSLFEGFGLVLLEAFALCKPVLVADVKPYDEIVDDGEDGFILPAHDSIKWSEKIIFILSNNTISENMGKKGRLKVEERFNKDKIIDRMEALYTDLYSRKKKNKGIFKE